MATSHSLPMAVRNLILLHLFQAIHVSIAQSLGPTPSQDFNNSGFTTTTGSIFAALLAIFILIAFFSVYFNRCAYGRNTNSTTIIRPSTNIVTTSGGEAAVNRPTSRLGLDQSVLETFPIMEYSAVKKLETVKGPLECAVCLSEFTNDESLRLLPGCCHVFHPDCIDNWLESHITCPVCRADLTKQSVPTTDTSINSTTDVEIDEQITDGQLANQEDRSGLTNGFDRFTLRLPDHVRREIENARRHKRSVSIAGYAYDRRGSGTSGRFWGIFRSFSLRRNRIEGSEIGEGSFKQVFPVFEDAGAPASGDQIIRSRLEESQSEAHDQSEMAVFDRV
ncbi:hypothetical protein LUZ60_005720 [Juncus effusus]|nr:hypothetical protein LUZ60_005720 [Juncus effusus]